MLLFFWKDSPLTIFLPHYCSTLGGHISPYLDKRLWVQVMRCHWDHLAQEPHGQGPQASTPQLCPQKLPRCPSCCGEGGSH